MPYKNAISVSLREDYVRFIDDVCHQKHYTRTQALEFVIGQYIEAVRRKARQFEKQAKENRQDQRNIEEMIYNYKQGVATQ